MNSRVRSNRELEVVLHALQIGCIAYEIFSIQGIGDDVDTATGFAFLVFVGNFFSSVHLANTPLIIYYDNRQNAMYRIRA